jgi:uncharacterized OB-fold protein
MVANVYRHGFPTDDQPWTLNESLSIRNPSSHPDILARQCQHCLRVYKGTRPICPYCQHDNKITTKQIQQQHETELVQIKKIQKITQGRAQTLDELIAIAKMRKYKHPEYWAKKVFYSRHHRV